MSSLIDGFMGPMRYGATGVVSSLDKLRVQALRPLRLVGELCPGGLAEHGLAGLAELL